MVTRLLALALLAEAGVTETYDTRETFRGAATRWVDSARKSPEPLIR
jgi:hypothetical protein